MKTSGEARQKRGFKLNVIDVILILIIIAAVSALVYIFMSGNIKNLGSQPADIEYEVTITRVREEFRGCVNVGDKVVDAVKLMAIGEVTNVRYNNSVHVIKNLPSGEIKYVDIPENLDLIITIKASAVISNGLYMINGYHISVGTLVSVRVPNFTESGYCTTIREVK